MQLRAFTTDATSKLQVLCHDGYSLGVDSTQVGVFEEADQIGFGGFLKRSNGCALETKIRLEVLSDFANKTLERQLLDQQLSGLLVATDLTESYGTGPVPVGFLDTSCSRGGLASCLGGELLAWGLASGGLAGGLLGTSHGEPVNFAPLPASFL